MSSVENVGPTSKTTFHRLLRHDLRVLDEHGTFADTHRCTEAHQLKLAELTGASGQVGS